MAETVKTYSKATPGRLPSFFRTIASGQNRVKDAWSKFSPTKPVRYSQLTEWYWLKITLTRITMPAKAMTIRSILIIYFPKFG